MTDSTIRIAMWSGPRNISTAMMRAWDSRADTAVMDEPFYAAYLASTGLDHPMRAEILSAHASDWQVICDHCTTAAAAPVVYQKHMSQHILRDVPLGWTHGLRHAFLIRPPGEVAASFREKWAEMRADDLGFQRQWELFDHIAQATGTAPPVVEARDVLSDPEGMLRALCVRLGVPWDRAMLSWAPGLRPTDGVWAPHWYNSVSESTGFAPPGPPAETPDELAGIVEICMPAYRRMAAHKLLV